MPLAARHVDTGMGFERVTAIIQGTKNLTDFSGTISNYETDIFRPIFDEIEKLSGKKYASTLPTVGVSDTSADKRLKQASKTDIAFRVIADHIRALSFRDCRRNHSIQRRPRLRFAPHSCVARCVTGAR